MLYTVIILTQEQALRARWKGHSLAREKVLALSRLEYARSSSATSETVIDRCI